MNTPSLEVSTNLRATAAAAWDAGPTGHRLLHGQSLPSLSHKTSTQKPKIFKPRVLALTKKTSKSQRRPPRNHSGLRSCCCSAGVHQPDTSRHESPQAKQPEEPRGCPAHPMSSSPLCQAFPRSTMKPCFPFTIKCCPSTNT